MACANGHINILEELLKTNKENMNDQNADGNTPLHWAVIN
jgi:ankyrin repeat protein